MTLRRAWPRALAPLALMALIFYLSAQPSAGPELPEWIRIVAHFTEYAVLVGLWIWTLAGTVRPLRRALLAAATISLLYAVSDEYHQSFVPGRTDDPLDVLTDAAGIAAACWLAQARGRASTRRTQSRSRG